MDPITREDLEHGGAWLAEARRWLQRNAINGDSITWGSSDKIKPSLTAAQIEDLALDVAFAAINEDRKFRKG